jgi:O-6-methylguanine DNA methyltransferase
MTDPNLRELRDAAQRDVSPDFTAKVFAECGFDRYTTAASALGDVFVAWNATGVSAVRLAVDEEAFEAWYGERFARRCVEAVELDRIATAARARLQGEEVDVPVDLRECSPFEQRVLQKAAEVGRGHARPYRWVARELGAPDATRAVGNALGRNPVPLLIPCHRIIRTDCSEGGYVFGSENKRKLLEAEGLDFQAIETVVHRGFRYVGCSEDGTFCLPTCGDIATQLSAGAPSYVGLRTIEEAHTHGLEPCSLCRPIAA